MAVLVFVIDFHARHDTSPRACSATTLTMRKDLHNFRADSVKLQLRSLRFHTYRTVTVCLLKLETIDVCSCELRGYQKCTPSRTLDNIDTTPCIESWLISF